jgi:hypothetical protein
MTLLDAQEPDPVRDRRQRVRITAAVALVITVLVIGLLGFLLGHGWWFVYLPKEHVVDTFFSALRKQDFNTAYAIWMHDPNWPQHPGEHATYPFNEFYKDWGPGGQWGVIKTAKVYGAARCPSLGSGTSGSGIVVDVIVNQRAEHAQVWVENSNHTLSFPPCELEFR